MHLLRYLVILIFGVSVVGCHHNPIDNQLQLAELIMEEHPDSALTILQAIDGSTLKGETQALHALLLSQAYDKNYIDLTDDSLISIATNYYLSSSDTHHKMLAHYYRASVNDNAGYYEAALTDALSAHDLATDPLNFSRIESLIARLYRARYSYQEAIDWAHVSLENAKLSEKKQWVYQGYYTLGLNYISLMDNEKVLQYADSAQMIAGGSNYDIDELRYYAYFFLKKNHEADSLYLLLGKPDILSRHQQVLHPQLDYEKRIEFLNKLIDEQNEFFHEIQSTAINKVRTEYDYNKRQILMSNLKSQRHLLIAIIIGVILLVALLVSGMIMYRIRAKANRLKLENDFYLLSQEYETVKNKCASQAIQLYEVDNLKRDISLSLLKRFSWIDHIGNIYVDSSIKIHKNNEYINKELTTLINKAKSDNFASEVDTLLKQSDISFWHELEHMNFNTSEKTMLYYFLSDISPRVISVLTDKTPAAIYNIKSRVKKKLRLINTPTALYLHDII